MSLFQYTRFLFNVFLLFFFGYILIYMLFSRDLPTPAENHLMTWSRPNSFTNKRSQRDSSVCVVFWPRSPSSLRQSARSMSTSESLTVSPKPSSSSSDTPRAPVDAITKTPPQPSDHSITASVGVDPPLPPLVLDASVDSSNIVYAAACLVWLRWIQSTLAQEGLFLPRSPRRVSAPLLIQPQMPRPTLRHLVSTTPLFYQVSVRPCHQLIPLFLPCRFNSKHSSINSIQLLLRPCQR